MSLKAVQNSLTGTIRTLTPTARVILGWVVLLGRTDTSVLTGGGAQNDIDRDRCRVDQIRPGPDTKNASLILASGLVGPSASISSVGVCMSSTWSFSM